MTREQRLAILGEATVAEIRQRVAQAPPPPEHVLEELRPIFAPGLEQLRQERAQVASAKAA